MRNLWLRLLRKLICDRRGHKIVQLPSPTPDPVPVLVLACTRCGLLETHPMRKLNRAHADERARWDTERRELIDTICALAGRPRGDDTVAQVADQPETEDSWNPFEDPNTIGDELHYTHIEEG